MCWKTNAFKIHLLSLHPKTDTYSNINSYDRLLHVNRHEDKASLHNLTMRITNRFLNWLKRPDHFFITLVSLLPIAITLMYATLYAYPYPYKDSWWTAPVFDDFTESAVNVAIKTVDGSLTIDDLFMQHNQHRIFFVKFFTMLSTLLTGWRTELDVLISIGAAFVNFVLLSRLAIKQLPRAFFLLIPFSLLIFSIHQDQVWMWGFLNSFVMVVMFFIAALFVIYNGGIGWRALILSLILLTCATFTMAGGLFAWPAMFIGLWLRGYRLKRYYAAYIFVMLCAIGLYFTGYDFTSSITLVGGLTVDNRLKYILRVIGAPLVARDSPYTDSASMVIGILGVAFLTVNTLFLVYGSRLIRRIAPWVTLALFSICTSIGMSINGYTSYLPPRYVPVVTPVWIVIVVLAFFVIWHVHQSSRKLLPAQILMYVNIMLLVFMIPLYIWTNVSGATNFNSQTHNNVYCVRNYPVDLNNECMDALIDQQGPRFYQRISDLSYHRLSVYRNLPEVSLFQTYVPGSPVIIEAERARQNFHILDRLPLDVPPENVLHLLSPEQDHNVSQILGENAQYLDTDNGEEREVAVENFIGEAEEVWYIYVNRERSVERWLNQQLDIAQRQQAYDIPDVPFTIVKYNRSQDQFYFGEYVSLRRWSQFHDVRVQQCQDISLETIWSTSSFLPENYSLTLVLVDENGVGLVQNDGNPSAVLTKQWWPGWVYTDERSLTIPCDLESGEYPLLIGLYDFHTLEALPITTPDGATVGDQLYLTTLVVE